MSTSTKIKLFQLKMLKYLLALETCYLTIKGGTSTEILLSKEAAKNLEMNSFFGVTIVDTQSKNWNHSFFLL